MAVKPGINIWRDGHWNNLLGYTPDQIVSVGYIFDLYVSGSDGKEWITTFGKTKPIKIPGIKNIQRVYTLREVL